MDDTDNTASAESIIDDLHEADVDLAVDAGQLRHTTFMAVAGPLSEIADQPPAFTLATAAMIGGIVTGRPRLARTGARVLASLAVATWIKATIKSKVVRTRPYKLLDEGHYETGLDGPDEGPYNSFPSGHTANAVAAARAIAAGGWYSATEFDLREMNDIVSATVELGRACVHSEYRDGSVTALMWAALLQYMDDADLRRGVPSANARYGNATSVVVGDMLFGKSSALVAELGPEAVRLQADTFERLVLGQMHETVGAQAGDDPVEFYLQVLADKTGSLIAASAQAGILFSDAPAEYRAPALEKGLDVLELLPTNGRPMTPSQKAVTTHATTPGAAGTAAFKAATTCFLMRFSSSTAWAAAWSSPLAWSCLRFVSRAISAAVPIATASAPSASAFATSAPLRIPPDTISWTPFLPVAPLAPVL